MNEEGGILKVPCCIQHSSVAHWINCVRNVHGHIPARYVFCQLPDKHAHLANPCAKGVSFLGLYKVMSVQQANPFKITRVS
jgi:hypothetical protein